MARLKQRLRELSTTGDGRFQEEGLKEFMEEGADVVPDEWHLRILLALLNQTYQVQEQAAWALAEAAATSPNILQMFGDSGGIADLREVLETPAFGTPALTAATVALGVACRGSPPNACRLVRDGPEHGREGDMDRSTHPKIPGLDELNESEEEAIYMAAGEVRRQVVDVFYMKHHLGLQFDRWLAKSAAGQAGEGSREAQTALAAICRNGKNPPWKVLLPHILARMVAGDAHFLKGEQEHVSNWAIALLTEGKGPHGAAVRQLSLPVLQELKESGAAEHEREKATWALSKLAEQS